jgi:hypothetical protein
MSGTDVLVLGAGFSRAVSEAMPLTNQLGELALDVAGLTNDPRAPRRRFTRSFSFENWMSLLAEDQPHLSEADNLANAAIFAQLRQAINTVLTSAESNVFRNPAPAWLDELLTVLHHRQATVVTLNYDTMVEAGVATLGLPGPNGGVISPRDILQGMPPLPNIGMQFQNPIAPTFELLKLHGSLDWWAASRDLSGASLVWSGTLNRFGAPGVLTEDERHQHLSGREPFIIPPSAIKSAYYQYPHTRELWQTAFNALLGAERVSLVGYSLPAADLVMSGMLDRALAGKGVAVDIVNPEPDDLEPRIRSLGVSIPTMFDTLIEFTHIYRDRAAADLAEGIAAMIAADYPATGLVVAKRKPDIGETGSMIKGLKRDGDTVRLMPADPEVPLFEATAVTAGPDGQTVPDESPRFSDLIAAAQGASKIVIRRNGIDETVVGVTQRFTEGGVTTKWIAFDSV